MFAYASAWSRLLQALMGDGNWSETLADITRVLEEFSARAQELLDRVSKLVGLLGVTTDLIVVPAVTLTPPSRI